LAEVAAAVGVALLAEALAVMAAILALAAIPLEAERVE
jgi:hypothetical protein